MTRNRSRLWRALVLTAVFCAIAVPVRADLHDIPARVDLQAGLDAYKRGDHVATLKEIGPLAKRGNADAQYLLGVMLAEGRGVAQDQVMALAWLSCAVAPRDDGTGGDEATKSKQPIVKFHKQAVQLRDSLAKQLPEQLADKARRIAKGCVAVAVRAKMEEEEIRSFYRYGLLERIFFFAGDTAIIGLMVIASQSGLDGLEAFINVVVNIFGNLLLGLISLVWWFFAARICFVVGGAIRRHAQEKVLKEGGDGKPLDDDERRRRSELL